MTRYVFEYFKSQTVETLRSEYTRYTALSAADDQSRHRHLQPRQILLDFLSTRMIKKLLKDLSREVAIWRGWDVNDVLMQMLPTPRIYTPRSHGTSIHCDFWYGHGENYLTIWVPLTDLVAENSFQICKKEHNRNLLRQFITDFDQTLNQTRYSGKFQPVLPPVGSAAVFSSTVLHHSLRNKSDLTRVSFDFRIGPISDKTSTKRKENFLRLSSDNVLHESDQIKEFRFIKYIRGGGIIDTLTQHVLIEGVARARELQIVGQEAEVERFGFPVLQQYLTGKCHVDCDGLIISSTSILSADALKACFTTNIKVYFCLESLTNWSD